jgi:hypothetical protein
VAITGARPHQARNGGVQVDGQVLEQRGQVLPGGGALPNVTAPGAEGGARAGDEYSPNPEVLVAARSNSREVTKSIVFLGGRSEVMRRPLLSRPDVSSVSLALDRRGSCSINHR